MAIYAMSSHLRARPADWPSHYHITGFFFDNNDSLFHLDSRLEEFVMQGSPPVVITLGSLAHSDPCGLAELLADAVRRAHCRAVVQGMSHDGVPLPDSRDIYWTDFAPHAWLFPRAACIVLHGGAGTAAAAFRSGVPTVFVPYGDCYDQRYWAQLAIEAGCSAAAIQYSDLTAEGLSCAIDATLHNQQLRNAAMSLAAKISKEPGVRLAARMISDFVTRVGLCHDCFDS